MNKNSKVRKTIHLIRHGQTDFNLQGIIQGSGVNSLLNNNGRIQAEKFFEAYKNEPYDHIYTSQLTRAIESVEGFIAKGISHTALTGLNEINWGVMEGKASNPEQQSAYEAMVANWTKGQLDISVENGETPLALFKRQEEALEIIMGYNEQQHILICMHGRAMRSFLCLLTDTPLRQMEQWAHNNLCLYELAYNGKNFDVVKACDVSHLQPERSLS